MELHHFHLLNKYSWKINKSCHERKDHVCGAIVFSLYDVQIEEVRQHIIEFKRPLKMTMVENCETWWYTLMFYLLDDVVDDLQRLGCLEVLDASGLESFSVHMK